MPKTSLLKQQLYHQCVQFMEDRLKIVTNQIEDIQQSLTSETKSSAGDKHETGRAMLQLEREKAGQQLAEIQKTKANLQKIQLKSSGKNVSLGSVVSTKEANYFICISAGALTCNGESYFAIAPNTPIGQLLMGKTVGDSVKFRDTSIVITKID